MFDDVLAILEDGRSHSFTEISDKIGISKNEVLSIVRFLSEFGFAQIDCEEKRVKLDSDFLKLPV